MSVPDLLADTLIREIEGGVGKIKGDEPTVFGLSSNFYPGFVKQYNAAVVRGDKVEMNNLREIAKTIYIRDYLRPIPGSGWLEEFFPALLALLFFGRVHGAGYAHYTLAVQRWLKRNQNQSIAVDGQFGQRTLKAVKELSIGQRTTMLAYLKSGPVVAELARRRIASVKSGGVSGVDRGLTNRIFNELRVADAINKDSYIASIADEVKPLEVTYNGTDRVRAGMGEDLFTPIINLV